MKQKQVLVFIVSRTHMSPKLIPPLKIIIPMLELLGPLEVYCASSRKIQKPIYNNLVKLFESETIAYPLEAIMEDIINEKYHINHNPPLARALAEQTVLRPSTIPADQNKDMKPVKFRICILGQEQVSWKIILNCKRRGIVADVAGKNAYLPYWTGGIHKSVNEKDIISAFMMELGVSTELRKHIFIPKAKAIDFTALCCCCTPNRKVQEAYLCSRCLAVHCLQTKKLTKQCKSCGIVFDT